MAELSIKLLGPFRAELDSQQLTGFRSDKVRALLSYLVVEAQRPWTRDQLADLMWPDFSEDKAQSYLRNALWNLKHVIAVANTATPFIIITQKTIQFNTRATYWADIDAFHKQVTKSCPDSNQPLMDVDISGLEKALALYQGDFLAGFTIDSPVFETWMVRTRENLRQERVKVLRCLSLTHHKNGKYELSLDYTKQWVEQEPWDESAYRHSMEILIALGRRNAALAQFETCQKRLAEDLGVDPEPETLQLYERIKTGRAEQPSFQMPSLPLRPETELADPVPLPNWLMERAKSCFEASIFVARQKELSQLNAWLGEIHQGHGRAAFVTSEPGAGKTFLLREFINQALHNDPQLLVLWGQCNAFTGQGDPYYPFITMTRMLAGDLEPLLPGSIISLKHLERVWRFLPETLACLIDHGPDLIRQFMPLINQFSLPATHPAVKAEQWESITSLLKRTVPGGISQTVLNDQFTQVIDSLSKTHPIVLILDDLQWIDPGSTSLLFHLGQQIATKKILLSGAFRSEEVWQSVDGKANPLMSVLHEFQANFGGSIIDLAASEGQDFVDSLLDSEPNVFSPSFHQMLYQHTSGHALFTIELLRGMQLRNEIRRDSAGGWIETDKLRWQELPARVEAVISRRISLMPIECQPLMTAACVQGEVFSVEVTARVTGQSEKEVFDLLSQQVSKRHRFITAVGITQIGEQRLTNYRFRHLLFQIFLYKHLDVVEKGRLHNLVGDELAQIYDEHLNQYPEIAHTLARHFDIAQITDKAVHYYTLAGKKALRLSAHQEAVQHFYHALELLQLMPPSSHRDSTELDLQLSLGPPLTALKGWGALELEVAYNRTQMLVEKSDENTKLIPALWLLATFRIGRSAHAEVNRLVARLFKLAQQTNDPALLKLAYMQISPFYQGKFSEARRLLERAAAIQDINQQRYIAHRFGMAPAAIALTYLSNCLWIMGYPEQANHANQQAIKIAEAVNHPMTTCYVISRACWIGAMKADLNQVQAHVDQLYQLASKYGFKNFEYAAVFFKNWLNFMHQKDATQPIQAMHEVIEAYYATKTVLNRTAFLVLFALVCLEAGDRRRGLERVSESIQLGKKTGELWFQAEAWRTKGELLLIIEGDHQLQDQDRIDAKTCFSTAYHMAREQGAKTFELRAAISLARLYQRQDRVEQAYQVLAQVYSWFSEGFSTVDLLEAHLLLDSLEKNI